MYIKGFTMLVNRTIEKKGYINNDLIILKNHFI